MVSAFELSIDAAAFWQYSIAKYAQTDVKKSTLILQDDYAFNVNLLLFCMLCDNASYRMSPALIAQIRDDIFDSEAVLSQHREKRRQAKAQLTIFYCSKSCHSRQNSKQVLCLPLSPIQSN